MKKRIPILMYHEVEDLAKLKLAIANNEVHPSYIVATNSFKQQLYQIISHGLTTLNAEDLNSNFDCDKPLLITFDDGYSNNYTSVFPELLANHMVGTFFVIASSIGFNRMMTKSQLIEMSNNCMSIQSHGLTHRPMASLSKKELSIELEESKKIIEDITGKEVCCLSLPHGSFDLKVLRLAREAGYKKIFTSFQGYSPPYQYLCYRINIRRELAMDAFNAIISQRRNFLVQQVGQSVKILIKSIIGDNNYLRLFHKINKLA